MFRRVIGSGILFGAVAAGDEGAMEFITSTEVTGSAVTMISFSSLSLAGYSRLVMICDFHNDIMANTNIDIELNGDSTVTNYWRARLSGIGSAAAASRNNDNRILTMLASRSCFAEISLGVSPDDEAFGYCFSSRSSSSNSDIDQYHNFFQSDSKSNITQIDLVASTANGFGIGTKIHLYGIKDS